MNSSSEVGLKIKPIVSAQAHDRKRQNRTSFAMQVYSAHIRETVKQQRNAAYEKPYKNSCIFIRDFPYLEKAQPHKTAISIYSEVHA